MDVKKCIIEGSYTTSIKYMNDIHALPAGERGSYPIQEQKILLNFGRGNDLERDRGRIKGSTEISF